MPEAAPDIELDPETFFERPDVYPMEFGQGQLTLVPMTGQTYHASIFLDRRRIVPAAREGWHLPVGGLLQELERRRPVRRPLRFIFHIAHCGSTLLSRALDVPGRNLVLREPYALRQLGVEAAAATGGAPDQTLWQRCLSLTGTLLGRRYAGDQPVIVKANVPVNFMIRPLLDLHPDNRALLLYCGFERYVLSVLKTEAHRRWVGNVARQLSGGIRATPGLEQVSIDQLSSAEAAACLWVSQMTRFRGISAERPAVCALDCDAFFAKPVDVLKTLSNELGLHVPGEVFEARAADGLFSRHGKDPGRPYDHRMRERELADLRERLATELVQARSWVDAIGVDPSGLLPAAELRY